MHHRDPVMSALTDRQAYRRGAGLGHRESGDFDDFRRRLSDIYR